MQFVGGVESSSNLCLRIRDIIRPWASHIINDYFGLVLAPKFESASQGWHLGVILARAKWIRGILITALACPEGPILTGLALVQQGMGIEGAGTRLLLIPLVDVILFAKTKPSMGVLPV